MKVPPKFKQLIWGILRNCLPSRSRLRDKRVLCLLQKLQLSKKQNFGPLFRAKFCQQKVLPLSFLTSSTLYMKRTYATNLLLDYGVFGGNKMINFGGIRSSQRRSRFNKHFNTLKNGRMQDSSNPNHM